MLYQFIYLLQDLWIASNFVARWTLTQLIFLDAASIACAFRDKNTTVSFLLI
jgi:hypothetical protein